MSSGLRKHGRKPHGLPMGAPVAGKRECATEAPSPDQIRRRAFELYLTPGSSPGDPVQDWLEAEELRAAYLSEPDMELLTE
jgi:hypothetical protein